MLVTITFQVTNAQRRHLARFLGREKYTVGYVVLDEFIRKATADAFNRLTSAKAATMTIRLKKDRS